MTEAYEKTRLKHLLERDECNALIYAFAGSVFSVSGVPDWFLAHSIWTGWIEHKARLGKLSLRQIGQINKLRRRGVNATIIRHNEGALEMETVDGKCISILHRPYTGIQFLEWLKLHAV